MFPRSRALQRPLQAISQSKRGLTTVETLLNATAKEGIHNRHTVWSSDEHLPQIIYYPRPHGIPVASLHFRSHHPKLLDLFCYFASHTGSALGIPMSKPIFLPTKRSMWTVLKGPFVHKKSQENFDRKVYKRCIKAWDAHPMVIGLWAAYLQEFQVPGVGLRFTRWERASLNLSGEVEKEIRNAMKIIRKNNARYKIEKLADEIQLREAAAAAGFTVNDLLNPKQGEFNEFDEETASPVEQLMVEVKLDEYRDKRASRQPYEVIEAYERIIKRQEAKKAKREAKLRAEEELERRALAEERMKEEADREKAEGALRMLSSMRLVLGNGEGAEEQAEEIEKMQSLVEGWLERHPGWDLAPEQREEAPEAVVSEESAVAEEVAEEYPAVEESSVVKKSLVAEESQVIEESPAVEASPVAEKPTVAKETVSEESTVTEESSVVEETQGAEDSPVTEREESAKEPTVEDKPSPKP